MFFNRFSSFILNFESYVLVVYKIPLNFACENSPLDVCLDRNADCLPSGQGLSACLCTAKYFEKNGICGKLTVF